MRSADDNAESAVAAAAGPAALPQLPSVAERRAVLWLTNVSHAVNHFQSGILSVLYPAIMTEFGIGYLELGILNAIRSMLNSALQGFYGFVTPFLRRTRILAFGNLLQAFGIALTAAAGSFWAFVGGRAVVEAGSSPQHPVGSSMLAGYFPERRGAILSLNTSFAGIGGFSAPLLAGFMLYFMTWRQILLIVAVVSLFVGVAYLFFGRNVAGPSKTGTGRGKLKQGWESYRKVLKNRNMMVISLVMMAGAAGRGGGVNDLYLVPHMVNDLNMTIGLAAVAKAVQQSGGIIGPLGLGWLSDHMSRKRVIQASLFLSAIGSWVLAWQGPSLVPLFSTLFVYGVFTHSRMTLTQALIADSVSEDERDAAFSAFFFIGFLSVPIWGIATGVMMEFLGFSVAFSVLAFTYLIGMALMSLIKEEKPALVS